MMAANIATAESGGYPEQQPTDNWWLPKWSSWLATIGAVVLAFFATLAIIFNIIPPSVTNILAGILQIAAAIAILAIEGPTVVSFLTFAKPIGLFFEGRSLYFKTAVYAALTIFPMLLGPDSIPVMLAFLVSASILCVHGAILIGRKGTLEDMRVAAEQPKI